MTDLNASLQPYLPSEDIEILYPCFRYTELKKALQCITQKMGFVQEHVFSTPYIFSYTLGDMRLIVLTTPVVFDYETLCYAFQGMLLSTASGVSATTVHLANSAGIWRKHPLQFYQDLKEAMTYTMTYRQTALMNASDLQKLPQPSLQSSIACKFSPASVC